MESMRGKTCVVTGANTGIGKVTAQVLASQGARVRLACRSQEKAEAAAEEIRAAVPDADVSFHKLDLGSLAAVRESAETLLAEEAKIHVLVNNAGLAGTRDVTSDGFEIAFGVNHLAHFLFTELLRPRLVESAPARIVIVASKAHYQAKGIEFDKLQQKTASTTGLPEYAVSKLSNVLHAKKLSRLLEGTGVTTYALHPGVVASDVWRHVPWPFRSIMKLFMISNEDGAKTTLHCATDAQAGAESGLYYDKCKAMEPSPQALDTALQDELWKRSLEWCDLPA